VTSKNRHDKKGVVIAILQNENDFGNTLNEEIFELPFVMGGGGSGLYYLVNDVSEDLEHFVQTGKPPEKDRGTCKEYHVFPREQEARMIDRWVGLGMTVTYHSQQVELACRITIAYMEVQNPNTSLSVSIIPWFMVAGRPYPIFVYVYAIGHYKMAARKSMEESAAVVRKLFGIRSFHKSTVSRSIGVMEGFADASQLDRSLSADALKKPCCLYDSQTAPYQNHESVAAQTSAILAAYPSFEALEKKIGERARRLPATIKRADRVYSAMGGIPDEQFRIIMHNEPANRKPGDRRKRPPRPRNKEPGRVQRPLVFIGYAQRERIRKEFIKISRHLVLDAATTYHRFLG